jgi:trehalose 6-phosphate phosphatase
MTADAIPAFTRLDPSRIALLLDVDGTLLDLAPGPFDVHVPAELRETLARLLDRCGGALALVSGRPIRDLDLLFAPLKLPAVGGHGAETRLHAGEAAERVADLPDALRGELIAAVTPDSPLDYEDKGYSVALHFRRAPQEEERLRAHIERVLAKYADQAAEPLPGKAIFEIKRAGVSKGAAVRALMQRQPFAGRMPVFIGDDVTDETVFSVMPELGGINFSVSREFHGVSHVFAAPADVRRALAQLAASQR